MHFTVSPTARYSYIICTSMFVRDLPHVSLAVYHTRKLSVVAWLHLVSPTAGREPQQRMRGGSEIEAE